MAEPEKPLRDWRELIHIDPKVELMLGVNAERIMAMDLREFFELCFDRGYHPRVSSWEETPGGLSITASHPPPSGELR